ncbi:putative 2-oxo-4-hydroxy-4-carboxy-5-ureidoimidazoline decarboxylase isoform X1 [Trichosurus vulpecula]|uniref:putative 2-oxo-4-hydroxy-4-carboxy-5-ureidoimidazoline decarboxylase isoform X1 n=1 Tax=Trichosurus vulpecula TaxID=9337 RepID=UPI00186AE458|nr:putative 2-oxo-4-hydroxy-4-carboxy-5-ureidoimidazoline decarboxylase isoform X1 [Trichosurus vulpecula]
MDIQMVNSMDFGEFVDVLGNIIEKCPLIAAAIWSQRPFTDLADLEKHVFDFIEALPQSGKEGILRCHPDLAGRELQQGTLTPESQREQRGAGLSNLGPEERRRLDQLNYEYKARFGFPFVIAARLSDKATMMRELERRLRNQPAQELRAALHEVRKICHLRLEDILRSPGDPAKL